MYRALVIATTIFALVTFVSTASSYADDVFKKAQKSAEGAVKGVENAATHPGRSAECAQGDTKVQRKIARETVEYATEHWEYAKGKKIADLVKANLVKPEDIRRAEIELYDFMSWTLGSPSLVCAQYITAGQAHFNNSFNSAAAAALVGARLPGGGRAQFVLPPKISAELKRTIQDCATAIRSAAQQATDSKDPSGTSSGTSPRTASRSGSQSKAIDPKAMLDDRATAALHEKLQGLPQMCADQVNQLRAQLQQSFPGDPGFLDQFVVQVADAWVPQAADAGVKAVDHVGFNLPKDYKIKRETIMAFIARLQSTQAAR